MKTPFCHRLTIIEPPKSSLAIGTDMKPQPTQMLQHLVPCMGPSCALFVGDPQHPLGGACGDLVQAIALARIAAVAEESFGGDEEEDPEATQQVATS